MLPSSILITSSHSPSSQRKGVLNHGKPWIHSILAITMTMSTSSHHYPKPLQLGGGGQAVSEVAGEGGIYISHDIQQYLKREFKTLCGSKSTLSREQLSRFFTETQSESIEKLDQEEYKFEEFLYLWYKSGSVLKEPVPQDLSKPISNYFISSSHNTYLDGNQLTSNSSTDAYKNVRPWNRIAHRTYTDLST